LPYFKTPDNCKLYYITHNFDTSGPVVVFLNGTSQTTIYWEPHAAALSKRFRLLFYDARAQGQSEIGTGEISAENHMRDLKNLLAHLDIKNAHLIGISHGAYIALRFAAAAPKTVAGLVLCSIGRDSRDYVRLIIKTWLEILQCADLEAMAWASLPLVFGKRFLIQNKAILPKIVNAIIVRNKKEALMAHFNAILSYPPPAPFLKKIQCPTLIISGADDPIVRFKDARQLAEDCRGRHEEFPQIGHSIAAEAPSLFQQVVSNFLERI
jgi:pimeloyl-ACP methyl ester carboxylesterase